MHYLHDSSSSAKNEYSGNQWADFGQFSHHYLSLEKRQLLENCEIVQNGFFILV